MIPQKLTSVFEWTVATEGHRWVKTRSSEEESSGEQPFLTTGVPAGGMTRVRPYFPLEEETALFRIFADTELEADAIRGFADTYGLLGRSSMVLLPETGDATETGGAKKHLIGQGERLDVWKAEIMALRRCLELYDLAVEQNLDGLGRLIEWRHDSVVYLERRVPRSRMIASAKRHPTSFERMQRGDLVRPALSFVQQEVDERLRELTAARLLWNAETDRLATVLMPHNLLGALWLQFAFAIENGTRFRQCAECRKWFELSPRTARSDKLFCSDACRVRAYRRRKAETGGIGTTPIEPTSGDDDQRKGSRRRGRPRKNRSRTSST